MANLQPCRRIQTYQAPSDCKPPDIYMQSHPVMFRPIKRPPGKVGPHHVPTGSPFRNILCVPTVPSSESPITKCHPSHSFLTPIQYTAPPSVCTSNCIRNECMQGFS